MTRQQTTDAQELEHDIAALLRPFAGYELPASADARIRERMLAGLLRPAEASRPRGRKFLWSLGVVAPLMAVTAVGAAAGSTTPIPNAVESAASAIGIGGNSGDVRQDVEHRAEQSSDNGQPGSSPGRSGDAPGLTGQARKNDSTTPTATGTPVPGETAAAAPEATKTPPHENGKGCDDVLFANGEPPFASPGGPVGCEVGNSGEHRKNGANATETPVPGEATPAPTPADDEDEDEDSAGGTSHGLGNPHSEDKPGNGQGNGHDVHEHEPNENGNGPGGSKPEATPTSGSPETPAAEPAATTQPGSQGNGGANGQGKGKGKNN